MEVILKLTHLSYHCLPLILISNRYWLFFYYAFECPVILNLCLWVSYNFQNHACKISHLNYASTLGSGLSCMLGLVLYVPTKICCGRLLPVAEFELTITINMAYFSKWQWFHVTFLEYLNKIYTLISMYLSC